MRNSKALPSSQKGKPLTDAAEPRREVCLTLIAQLSALRQSMLDRESARNLIHYLTELPVVLVTLPWIACPLLGYTTRLQDLDL